MKKVLLSIVIFTIFITGSGVANADYWEISFDSGFVLPISDRWNCFSEQSGLWLKCSDYGNEELFCGSFEIDWAYDMNAANIDYHFNDLCNAWFSNQAISQKFSKQTGANVRIINEYENRTKEIYNNTEFFRYEKIFTANASGFVDTQFYVTTFMTVRNGTILIVYYTRDESVNNFNDIIMMMTKVVHQDDIIKINVNGNMIKSDANPILVDNRTMVPIRAVAEALGYNVGWDEMSQSVSLSKNDVRVDFFIGGDVATRTGDWIAVTLDVAPVIIDGYTYIPLRAAAELMDAEVSWIDSTKTVEIWK